MAGLAAPQRYREQIFVKAGGKLKRVDLAEVQWIGAAGNYIELRCAGGTHMLRTTLRAFEAELNPRQFLRIHRSALVRIERVRELQPKGNGDYAVFLHDGTQLTLSRGYRDNLQSLGVYS